LSLPLNSKLLHKAYHPKIQTKTSGSMGGMTIYYRAQHSERLTFAMADMSVSG